MPTLRLRGARRGEEVGAVEPTHLQGVGLVGLHGVQRLVGLGGSHAGGRAGPRRRADALLPHVVGHGATLLHAPLAEQGRRRTEGQAAGTVDGAGEGSQDDERLGQLHAVLVLVEREAPRPADRALGADDVRDALDVLGVDAGDLGNLVDGVLGRAGLHVVEAVDPLLGELLVVLAVLEHEVHDGEGQGRVGLRADLQVDVAVVRAHPRDAGVDGDDLRAKLHQVDEAVAEEAVTVGGQGLLAPDHDPLRHGVARVLVAARQVTGVVELGVAGAQHVVGDGATRAVAGPTGLRVAAVGRLQHRERQRIVEDASLAAGAAEADDGLGAVGVLEVAHLVADGVQGLVPRGLNPLVLAAVLRVALHRVDDARRRVRVLAQREVHRVHAARGDGVVVVALDADELAVLRDNLDAVSHRVASRRRPRVAAGYDSPVFHHGLPLFTVCHVLLLSTLSLVFR